MTKSLLSHFPILILTALTTNAFAQSDEDLLARVRLSAVNAYIEQASFTLPDSFDKRDLTPEERKRTIHRWARESAACHSDSLAVYAENNQISLAELVSEDGTYGFSGGVSADWEEHLYSCLRQFGNPSPAHSRISVENENLKIGVARHNKALHLTLCCSLGLLPQDRRSHESAAESGALDGILESRACRNRSLLSAQLSRRTQI